ncbi:hypothetical protein [Sphingomonas qomolangmaensis]|uniref:Uncharacterized protein n=1 Tax=Sphingomonas qomolangmaensis TaxID=2918765 RepID=A0ABY5LCZ2_9SPHN|nr:hypothetical protein [Sphingomonas qomolangmaensis]UUL83976.1 hypothetical protein NMP03_07235 [Sphingomonas qomolangmaensis]
MLAIDFPQISAALRVLPGGLVPIYPNGRLSLAVKLSKEALLAIRQHRGFAVYVVPFGAKDGLSFGFVSAFFDDADEPLVVRTPLFGDDDTSLALVGMMLAPEIDVYFVDDLGRDRMAYRCTVEDPGSHLQTQEELRLPPQSHASGTDILYWLQHWFGHRTSEDDARAIRVRFAEPLWPEDLAILDVREGVHNYVGSDGYAISMLERDSRRPGYFQERDIAEALRRFMAPQQIILNPFKRGSDKEFVDVVAATGSAILLIQAKDSPNTAESLARTIDRKLRKSQSQIAEAVAQGKGALNYAGTADPILLTVLREDIDLHRAGRPLISVAIVKEIFPSQAESVADLMRAAHARGEPLLILDYMGFSAFAHYATDEARFVTELEAWAKAFVGGSATVEPRAFLVDRYLARLNDGGAGDAGAAGQ